jgi:uncharacterized repeat protein (TIGR03803 family)
MGVLALASSASGQTLTTIYQFGGVANGGAGPNGVMQGSDGNFYGTTSYYGMYGNGTVFRINASGALTNLLSFNGSDGMTPWAGLVQGNDGNFYGTTEQGGAHNNGTVFKMYRNGTLANLYSFCGPSDGFYPLDPLVQANDGNFYGTANGGGVSNLGTVFRISPGGALTNLHSFIGADGQYPVGGLVQGSDESLYGTTYSGGNTNLNGGFGYGTVFGISLSGTLTNLYSFSLYDGGYPSSGLIQGNDGNFYGTTRLGGTNSCNCGTVFRITPAGILTTLYEFSRADGAVPYTAPLVLGSDGDFYGTTSDGGTNGDGTVFKITPQGTLTTLYQFGGLPTDGQNPWAGLVQGSDGDFYGTASSGGTNSQGTVFKLSVPLNPPANQISSAQVDSSGTNLVFSIPSVAYETYQLQFSPSINPTNWSNVSGTFVSNSIGALLTLTNFGGASQTQGFYRFAITP